MKTKQKSKKAVQDDFDKIEILMRLNNYNLSQLKKLEVILEDLSNEINKRIQDV